MIRFNLAYIDQYTDDLSQDSIFEVSILHPENLPQSDVIKLDVEGAETLILENTNLEQASLILVEYHNDENKDRIKKLLYTNFTLVHEDSSDWDAILPNSNYRKNLSGDHYGILFFINNKTNKLLKADSN